jgi:TolA-binding protein
MSNLRTGALASALVLLASGVLHADAKDTRKQVSIKVKATDQTRIKKLEPKPDDTKKNEHPDQRISADDFLEIETEQGEINEQLIEEYKGAISDAEDDDPKKPEYMFRLAEAYSQEERHFHAIAMEASFRADQEQNANKKAKAVQDQKKAEKEEAKWLVLAVKAYTDIVKNPQFKTYPRNDEVYFFLAYTLNEAKRPEDARKIFTKLTKEYPESKYIPDAYLALADAFFNENNLKDAEAYYDKVLKFPKNPIYPYALYKKGWVVYNEAKPKDSYAAWIKVAEITSGKQKDAALNRAAKKDMVRAYAEFGDETQAMNAFKRVDNDFAPTMFEILGGYYLDNQGKFTKAIYVFRELISMYPTSPKICDWEYKVVQAIISVGTPADRFKEFTSFAKLYKYIKEKQLLKDDALKECRENAAGTVKEWAVFLHMEAVKTLNPTTLGYAADLYGLYQQYFPDADDSLFILYLYAELS